LFTVEKKRSWLCFQTTRLETVQAPTSWKRSMPIGARWLLKTELLASLNHEISLSPTLRLSTVSKKSQSNLGRSASLHPYTEESSYATKFPLVTMGRPTFIPNCLFLRQSPPPSNTPIPRLTPLTTPNGIQILSAVLHTLDRQTDRSGGLHARLCHAFLVILCFSQDIR